MNLRSLPLLLLLAAPAAALDVTVEVGLDGLLVDGGWAPLEVRCTLGPDEPRLEGRVVVERPRELVGRIEAPLRVEPGETAVARLVVPVTAGATYAARVVDADGRTLATALPAGAGVILMPDERLVVFAGPVGLPGLADGGADRPRIARLAPERLPRDARLLAAAQAVVLKPPPGGAAAFAELARDPAAAAALERFVRQGGALVLVAGDGPWWRDGPLDALAPARVDGRGEDAVAALDPGLGLFEAPRPLAVLACTPRPGAVVAWAGERHPLVIERAHGRGRVTLVAFDPDQGGLRGAPRTSALLAGLLPAAPPAAPPLRGHDALALLGDLLDATPGLAPGWFYGLTLALAVQLLGVSVLTAALVRRRGPWAALVAPPAVSLVVTGALLVAGALARGAPRVTQLLVQVADPASDAPPGGGHVLAALGVVAGARAEASVELPAALLPEPQPLSGLDALRLRAAGAALALRPGRPALVGPLEVPAHGRAALLLAGHVDGDAPWPALSARALPGPAATWPAVEVTSHDARPLEGLVVMTLTPAGPRTGALRPLAPGATATFSAALAAPPLDDLQLDGPLDPGRGLLLRVAGRLEAAAGRPPAGAPPPPVVAWVLHAAVEEGAAVPFTDRRGARLAGAARTVRVTCVPVLRPEEER
ncbi:MAG: hypothetical protein M9894_11695 [Planctomycetes bacterium]|nr:hypothetical protein [Planctomycetota bacterium]